MRMVSVKVGAGSELGGGIEQALVVEAAGVEGGGEKRNCIQDALCVIEYGFPLTEAASLAARFMWRLS